MTLWRSLPDMRLTNSSNGRCNYITREVLQFFNSQFESFSYVFYNDDYKKIYFYWRVRLFIYCFFAHYNVVLVLCHKKKSRYDKFQIYFCYKPKNVYFVYSLGPRFSCTLLEMIKKCTILPKVEKFETIALSR